MSPRPLLRAGILTAVSTTLIGLTAVPAFAHVTVHADEASPGSYAKLTFRVPTEENTASTTQLQVTMPTDTPIPSVSVQPHPGWSFQVRKTTLDKPIQTDDGPVREVVSQITWTATSPSATIGPGEFDEFAVSAGPLPENASTLRFPAVQTYSNQDVVRWIETAAPGAPEPEHPAPDLRLESANAASTTPQHASESGSTTALALAIVALVIALGAAGGTGYALTRRR